MNLVTPDSGLIFWMTLVFAIVFFLLAKFGFPVITSMIDKRGEKIEGSLKDAELAREKVEHLKEMQEQMLSQARSQQAELLSQAAQQRQELLDKTQKDAQALTEKILEEARKQIETEKENAQREIRAQVSEMSLKVAEKILRKELSDEKGQQEYLDEVFKDMDKQ